MNTPLISIIMAAYNADRYIQESIESVLSQDYPNWELLIINDGSTDATERIVKTFNHPQIHYFQQQNKGVSAARNIGLQQMKGDYFCFLDADDKFKPANLSSRMAVFMDDPTIDFVDGGVEIKSNDLQLTLDVYQPKLKGNPLAPLLNISRDCFFGITWLIKRQPDQTYHFVENIRHAEDLLFYISIAKHGNYSYTNQLIAEYRSSTDSAMSNTLGLEKGYTQLIQHVKEHKLSTPSQLTTLKKRVALIMFKTYFKKLRPLKAMFTYTKLMSI